MNAGQSIGSLKFEDIHFCCHGLDSDDMTTMYTYRALSLMYCFNSIYAINFVIVYFRLIYAINNSDRIWEKGPFRTKCGFFLPFYKLPPFQGTKSPRLLSWFICGLGLLLYSSSIRSYIKSPVPSSEPPKRGIKRQFSNAIDSAKWSLFSDPVTICDHHLFQIDFMYYSNPLFHIDFMYYSNPLFHIYFKPN
jgi:hypothetical protein